MLSIKICLYNLYYDFSLCSSFLSQVIDEAESNAYGTAQCV